MKKTKLEEILETTLPVSINKNTPKPTGCLEVRKIGKSEFMGAWKYGDQFSLLDYPALSDKLEKKGIDVYCLHKPNGEATLSITKAYQETPGLKFPYLELCVEGSGGSKAIIFLYLNVYLNVDGELKTYTPSRGNTIRLDRGWPINDSGIFDFKWQNKNILEESDLLYLVKEINRPALSEYKLETIYEAFQEYKNKNGAESIVIPDRNLCVQEFEEMLYFGD